VNPHVETGAPLPETKEPNMTLALTKTPLPGLVRPIAHRFSGQARGPITRLMSPSDVGHILKPFVFLDLVDHEGPPFEGSLHPHSGIATVTYLFEGTVGYIDPDNIKGVLRAGGVEWMQAGRGMWHGGGLDEAGRTRGFQLWIALPPALELGPTISIYQAPQDIQSDGPARVLLGGYGAASSAIVAPSPLNYLAVRLKAGERWRYQPPTDHTVLWTAIAFMQRTKPDVICTKSATLLSTFNLDSFTTTSQITCRLSALSSLDNLLRAGGTSTQFIHTVTVFSHRIDCARSIFWSMLDLVISCTVQNLFKNSAAAQISAKAARNYGRRSASCLNFSSRRLVPPFVKFLYPLRSGTNLR